MSHSDRRAAGSSPVVGSSRKTSSGSLTSDSATARRWRWPPDSTSLRALRRSPSSSTSMISCGRARAWIEAAEQVDELGHRQLRVQGGGLEADPDARLERVGAAGDVDAEDADLAPVGLAQPLEDLDGRGLARTVRAEQAEDLALRDVEVDAVDGLDVAVALGQAADADDGFGVDGGAHRRRCWHIGRGLRRRPLTAPVPPPGPPPTRRTSRYRARSRSHRSARHPRAPARRASGTRPSPLRVRRPRRPPRTGSISPRARRSTPATGRVPCRSPAPGARGSARGPRRPSGPPRPSRAARRRAGARATRGTRGGR